jgi:hypothetical protein
MANIEALGWKLQWELLQMGAQAFPCVGDAEPDYNGKRR